MKRREFLMASMGATIASTIKLEGQTPPPAEKTDVVEVGEMLDPDHLICVKPHVQLISETEVGLVWMTSKEAEGWVEWSQDDGETWKRAWNERDGLLVDACDRIHKITVSGYSPAKPFRYRVRSRAFTSFGPYRVVRSAEEAVYEGMMPLLNKYNFGVVKEKGREPIYFPADDPLIVTLMDVYKEHTGDAAGKPIVIGGGTYARATKGIVAFGPRFPGEEEMAHQRDEYISIDSLMKAAKIYAEAIYKLTK